MTNNKTSKSCSSDNTMPMQSQEVSSFGTAYFSANITKIKTSNAGKYVKVVAYPTSRAVLVKNNQVTSTSTKNADVFARILWGDCDSCWIWLLTVNYENKTKIAKVVDVKAANHDGRNTLEFNLATEEIEKRGATATDALNWDNASQGTASFTLIYSPPVGRDTVYDLLAKNEELSMLETAINAAGLADALADENHNYTVFAPTVNAFAKLPAGTFSNLLKPRNKEDLVRILKNHVVEGHYSASELTDMTRSKAAYLHTLNGTRLKVTLRKDKLYVGNAQVVAADKNASNGLIHTIDAVLCEGNC